LFRIFIIDLLNTKIDCDERYDCASLYSLKASYSLTRHFRFDKSNNITQCYTFYDSSYKILSPYDEYQHRLRGDSTGITDMISITPMNSNFPIDSFYSKQYWIQSQMETELIHMFDQLPVWLSSQCHLLIRQLYCGRIMLKTTEQSLGSVLRMNGVQINSSLL
jgi:hypothetical protein